MSLITGAMLFMVRKITVSWDPLWILTVFCQG